MKLFEMKDWVLTVSEEAWGLAPFNAILKRDKTKNKDRANAEMLFIWYFCDIKSSYLLMSVDDREKEILNDIIGLPKGWKIDKVIQAAIDFYIKFDTVIEHLYKQSLQSAYAIGDYLGHTKALLAERDASGKPVTKVADITRGLKDVKTIIKELKETEKEVIKEQLDNVGKQKGSKKFSLFEDGLS
ncbi:MAG: hypothetical protein KUG81_09030 [Gammaproteobacteria bacterium]|nr:hypothetical protein [Gammaproteobacteria bacterium]